MRHRNVFERFGRAAMTLLRRQAGIRRHLKHLAIETKVRDELLEFYGFFAQLA